MITMTQQILDLTSKLISIPSFETEEEIATFVYQFLVGMGYSPEIVASNLDHPSLYCHMIKPGATKTVWLESPLDTAEPGNPMKWETQPLQATLKGDKLCGLGVSDAKFAIAEFIYLADKLYKNPEFNSSIFLGFDAAEQSGKFTGIRDLLEYVPDCDLCILGYQDFNKLHIGARGWLRIKLQTIGKAAHSGRSQNHGVNAVHKLVKLINAILEIDLAGYADEYFKFGPKLNFTQIKGGEHINILPDKAECFLDIRLTPLLSSEEMIKLIGNSLRNAQLLDPDIKYQFNVSQSEPAYLSDPNDRFIQTLLKNSRKYLNPEMYLVASGPGSVGNLISQRFSMPIINSFGVRSDNVHSPNEYIDVTTVQPAFETLEKSLVEWSNN